MPPSVVRLLLPAALLPRLTLAAGSAGVGSGPNLSPITLLLASLGAVVFGVALFFVARRRPARATPPLPVRPPAAVAPSVFAARPQPGLPRPLSYLRWFFAVVVAGFVIPLLLYKLSPERFGWWAYSFLLAFFYVCVLLVPPHLIALFYYLSRYLSRPDE